MYLLCVLCFCPRSFCQWGRAEGKKIRGKNIGCSSHAPSQCLVDVFQVERFGVELLADPFEPLFVFRVFGVAEGFEYLGNQVACRPPASPTSDTIPGVGLPPGHPEPWG